MDMAAMDMMSTGVSLYLEKCPQEVASVFFKKIPTFGSRLSNLDHLTAIA
jgi:hypothetical protein